MHSSCAAPFRCPPSRLHPTTPRTCPHNLALAHPPRPYPATIQLATPLCVPLPTPSTRKPHPCPEHLRSSPLPPPQPLPPAGGNTFVCTKTFTRKGKKLGPAPKLEAPRDLEPLPAAPQQAQQEDKGKGKGERLLLPRVLGCKGQGSSAAAAAAAACARALAGRAHLAAALQCFTPRRAAGACRCSVHGELPVPAGTRPMRVLPRLLRPPGVQARPRRWMWTAARASRPPGEEGGAEETRLLLVVSPCQHPPRVCCLRCSAAVACRAVCTCRTAASTDADHPCRACCACCATVRRFPGDDGIALATMDIFAGCGGLSEGMHQAGELMGGWWGC